MAHPPVPPRWPLAALRGGFGAVTQVAIDGEDRLHALVATGRPWCESSTPMGISSRRHRRRKLAGRFPPLPFAVGPKGRLFLGPLCDPPLDRRRANSRVRRQRTRVQVDAPPETPPWVIPGEYLSGALDSELYRCQWHRVVLEGAPPGRAWSQTFTAEDELDDAATPGRSRTRCGRLTTTPTPPGWTPGRIASFSAGGGRYSWLRLFVLSGNPRANRPRGAHQLASLRISLRRYLPALFGAEPVSAHFTHRFHIFTHTTLRGIEATLDDQDALFDPTLRPKLSRSARAPPDSQPGSALGSAWASTSGKDRVQRRRALLRHAGQLGHRRGTREGLRQLLLGSTSALGRTACVPTVTSPGTAAARCPPTASRLRATILRLASATADSRASPGPALALPGSGPARRRRDALAGKLFVNLGQLDANAQEGVTRLRTRPRIRCATPFDSFAHRFSVFVPSCVVQSPQWPRKALELLLRAERPARTVSRLVAVEPRFRIGVQSMAGFDRCRQVPGGGHARRSGARRGHRARPGDPCPAWTLARDRRRRASAQRPRA